MPKPRPSLCLSLVASSALFLNSCKESNEENVGYREISDEETAESMQRAFVKPTAGTAAASKGELHQFFEELSKATQSDDAIEAERFLSVEAMMSSLESTGSAGELSRSERRGFETGFRSAIPQLAEGLKYPLFDRFKICLIENLSVDTKLVYNRLYDSGDNIVNLFRYWMIKTADGWRIYDYEDLSMGMRTVSLMSLIMSEMSKSPPGPWVEDFLAFSEQLDVVDFTDPEKLETIRPLLVKLRKNKLPGDIQEFASSMMITVHTMADENELALKEIEAAEKGGYTTPLHFYDKANVMASLERHEEALTLFDKHMEKFGRDSDTLELVSDSHLSLGNVALARETALEGLKDNPKSMNCAASLAAATPKDGLSDPGFVAHFDGMTNPEEAFEIALDFLIDLERLEQAVALFAVFQKKFPESELIEYYQETLSGKE